MLRKIIFTIQNALRWTFLILIQGYQKFISPFLGNHCRFYPSCSQYAHDAFTSHSFFKALYLTVRRLLCCHPFHQGGFDSVTGVSCEHEVFSPASTPANTPTTR